MNVGIRKSNGSIILFMNAEMYLIVWRVQNLQTSNIRDKKCYSFKTLQVYENISIVRENVPKKGFLWSRLEKNLPPHQGFFAPNEKKFFSMNCLKSLQIMIG